jgi:hypothetical protein
MGKAAMSKEGVEGVGKGNKISRMQFCLAEAQRCETQSNLRNAVCISISQDKRASRFLMRYKCCNDKLELSCGILTHSRDVADLHHHGADCVRRTTLLGIEHACSRLAAPNSSDKAFIDSALFDSVVKKVECFAADGASDQQLAGRELAGALNLSGPEVQGLRGTLVQSLPSLKVHVTQH